MFEVKWAVRSRHSFGTQRKERITRRIVKQVVHQHQLKIFQDHTKLHRRSWPFRESLSAEMKQGDDGRNKDEESTKGNGKVSLLAPHSPSVSILLLCPFSFRVDCPFVPMSIRWPFSNWSMLVDHEMPSRSKCIKKGVFEDE
jgi:hypothetical protein